MSVLVVIVIVMIVTNVEKPVGPEAEWLMDLKVQTD
jgi:hypothetical protein